MLLLGLVLLLAGVVLLIGGLFTADVTSAGNLEIAGIGVSPATLFVLGLIAAVALLLGLWLAKVGAKRDWRRRREQKEMGELSEKLDRADANRRRDLDDENS